MKKTIEISSLLIYPTRKISALQCKHFPVFKNSFPSNFSNIFKEITSDYEKMALIEFQKIFNPQIFNSIIENSESISQLEFLQESLLSKLDSIPLDTFYQFIKVFGSSLNENELKRCLEKLGNVLKLKNLESEEISSVLKTSKILMNCFDLHQFLFKFSIEDSILQRFSRNGEFFGAEFKFCNFCTLFAYEAEQIFRSILHQTQQVVRMFAQFAQKNAVNFLS